MSRNIVAVQVEVPKVRHTTAARRVHWLCWLPTPYNDYLFQHLARDRAIDLTVHYRSRVLSSHPWQSTLAEGYRARFYNLVFGVDWYVLSLIFRDRQAFFVVAGWDHPTSQILLTLLRFFGLSYALWTDTPNLKRKRSPMYARARAAWLQWILSGAVKIMGTGQPGVHGLKELGASEEQLINFPFWVDLAAYARVVKPRGYDADRPLQFVSSGRINNRLKGHDIAVRALAQAAEKGGVPFECWIAGTGPDESDLKDLINKIGLAGKVKCLGWVEPDDLRALYLKADALIHPSPMHDPFPNAILEGMAAGLVVFGSNVSGSAVDRIEHGRSGFIHLAGDVSDLAGQMSYLLQHPERISEMARQARMTAEQWPVEKAVEIVKGVIRQCAAS
jgi:glycosyltransferase involved in cell wall biosynthesis